MTENKLAEVVGFFDNGSAMVKFDGEETPSEKEYGFLRSYIPKLGDRVLMLAFADSYIIIDAVDYNVPVQKPIDLNNIKGDLSVTGRITSDIEVIAPSGDFENLTVKEKIEAKDIYVKSKVEAYAIEAVNIKAGGSITGKEITNAQKTADEAKSTANTAKSNSDINKSSITSINQKLSAASSNASTALSNIDMIKMDLSRLNIRVTSLESQVRILQTKVR
ncbi:MAG: hypothetical protein Q4P25_05765 [Tissierellia bacterium]|nr:hypothetical protein [Tissierellia bacterium]